MPLSREDTKRRLETIFDYSEWYEESAFIAEATYLVNALVADGVRDFDEFFEGDQPGLIWLNYESDTFPNHTWNDQSIPCRVVLADCSPIFSYLGTGGQSFVVLHADRPSMYSCHNCAANCSTLAFPSSNALTWYASCWLIRKFCPTCAQYATWHRLDDLPEQAHDSLDRDFNWLNDLQPHGPYRVRNDVPEFLIHGDVITAQAPPSRRPPSYASPHPSPAPSVELKVSVVDHVKNVDGLLPSTEILSYSESPFRRLGHAFLHASKHSPPKNGRYYGVELEWETLGSVDAVVETMAKLIWPFGIITSDSSLRQGAEIKTLPATLGAHRELWKPFFAGKPGKIASSWSTGRCGMHVHVSAASVSHLTLGKLNAFYNTPSNLDFINIIAGRDVSGNSYCYPNPAATKLTSAFASKRAQVHFAKIKRAHYAGRSGRVEIEHHNAFVSRETSKGTYELRIFRGNLAEGGFMKNLEFTDAVITWAEETPLHAINQANFRLWMQDAVNMARYRYLAAFLEAKSLLSGPVHGRTVYLGEELGRAAD